MTSVFLLLEKKFVAVGNSKDKGEQHLSQRGAVTGSWFSLETHRQKE